MCQRGAQPPAQCETRGFAKLHTARSHDDDDDDGLSRRCRNSITLKMSRRLAELRRKTRKRRRTVERAQRSPHFTFNFLQTTAVGSFFPARRRGKREEARSFTAVIFVKKLPGTPFAAKGLISRAYRKIRTTARVASSSSSAGC